jgi:sodium/bile acid cotransporter 7
LLAFAAYHLCFSATWCRRPSSDEAKMERIDSLFQHYAKSFPAVRNLSVEGFLAEREQGNVILVDVREPGERQVSMIPGAVSAEEFERDKAKYADQTIVTYCTIGYRSGIFAQELSRENFRSFNIEGGILAWAHAGQELINENGTTRRVHTYGHKWNLLPDGYEAVW